MISHPDYWHGYQVAVFKLVIPSAERKSSEIERVPNSVSRKNKVERDKLMIPET